MKKQLENIAKQFIEDQHSLNKIFVSIFLKTSKLKIKNNILLKHLLIDENESLFEYVKCVDYPFGFNELIEAFELAIPLKDKVVNGAIYTPNYIKEYIVENSINKLNKPISNVFACDISCGCGAFLYTLSLKIKKETGKSFRDIYRNNIFGLDICISSIERAKILLSLLAAFYGEDEIEFDFNLFTSNALSFNWLEKVDKIGRNKGFDLIVGNPPYVRAKNIDSNTKSLLKKWSVTKTGNTDLYIPFFEIGLNYLNENGVLGYITVNSFYKSVNGRLLRKYFQLFQYDLSIIDFGNEKIFCDKLAYTCICIITKKRSKEILFKKESSDALTSSKKRFTHLPYNSLDHRKGWLLNDQDIVENINKIEKCGPSLGSLFKIKNGIATLSNKTYVFKPTADFNDYYLLKKNGIEYEIEKTICRDIIKPNVLKYEYEIEILKEKLIFPYINDVSPLSLMSENHLKINFPKAYKYLLDNKEVLLKRDKGECDYGAWYAFGRTQALFDNGYKLLFPYMAKKPHFVFTDQKNLLIYCGYAVFGDSAEVLIVLKKILESNVFDFYMRNTSKPYASGYFSYAKNYVKNFGICSLDNDEKKYMFMESNKDKINNFLCYKYGLSI